MNSSKSLWLLGLLMVAGFAGVWQLQRQIDVQRGEFAEEQDDLVVRSPKLAKIASMEFAPLMADLYWTQAVQYYGNKQLQHRTGLDLLWPLLDIATTLDPNLIPAYEFGSAFLAPLQPTGAGQPDRAVALVQRGIRENPGYWRFYANLGYIYYFEVHDYTKASQAFLDGSKVPGAMEWMKVMAARVAAIGNSMDTSKFLWVEIERSSTDEKVRENAKTHLQLIQVDEDCRALNELSETFEKRTGQRATRIKQLIDANLVGAEPVDPLGYPYVLNAYGLADLNPKSPLIKQREIISPKKPLLQ
jgi:hypothetical protein